MPEAAASAPPHVPPERCFEVLGDSMRFLLRSGDLVLVRRVDPQELRVGDLVLYLKDKMSPVVHRLLWRGRGGRLRTKGDAVADLDAPPPVESLVGKVTAYRRGDGPWRATETLQGRALHCAVGLASWLFFATPYPERGRILLQRAGHLQREARRRLRDAWIRAWFLTRDAALRAWQRSRAAAVHAWRLALAAAIHAWCLTRDAAVRGFLRCRAAAIHAYCVLRDGAWRAWRSARDEVLRAWRSARDGVLRAWGRARGLVERGWKALREAGGRRLRQTTSWASRRGALLCAGAYALLAQGPARRGRRALLRLAAAIQGTPAGGRRIEGDVLWEGTIRLEEDVVVLPGSRLRIAAGTIILAPGPARGENAWVERLSFGAFSLLSRPRGCHLIVLGRLEASGTEQLPILFDGPGWSGILLLGGARARIAHALLRPFAAFAAVLADQARGEFTDSVFEGGWGGVACTGSSSVALRRCRASGAERAAFWSCDDARVSLRACEASEGGVGVRGDGDGEVRSARCVLRGQRGAGAHLAGRARLVSREGLWQGNEAGLIMEGRSKARLRKEAVSENRTCGFCVRGAAELRGRLSAVERQAGQNGLFIGDRGSALLSGCRIDGNRTAVEAVGSARVVLESTTLSGNESGAWVQNRARLSVRETSWRANKTACRVSGRGRLRLKSTMVEGGACGIRLEDHSRLWARSAEFSGTEVGISAVGHSRIRARGLRLSGAAVGVWLYGESRAIVVGGTILDSQTGLKCEGEARLAVKGSGLLRLERGLSLSGRARATVRGAVFSCGGVAIDAAGRSRVSVRRAEFAGNAVGFWAQNSAEAALSRCRWRADGIGVRASHWSRLRLARASLSEHPVGGVLVEDAARVLGSRVEVRTCGTGIDATGAGTAVLAGLVAEGNRTGVWIRDRAEVRCSGGSWRENGVAIKASGDARGRFAAAGIRESRSCGVFVEGRALCTLSEATLEGNPVGLQALGESRAILLRSLLQGNGQGVWAQNASGVLLEGCVLSGNEVGAKASHASRLEVLAGSFAGHARAGLFIEDEAAAELRGCDLDGNENGILALHGSRASVRHCKVRGSRDTGLWHDYRARVALEGVGFLGNRLDRHCEPAPHYGEAQQSLSATGRIEVESSS